jgi:hypothetical protein
VELRVVANHDGEPIVVVHRFEPEALAVVGDRRAHVTNRERRDRPAQARHERLRA